MLRASSVSSDDCPPNHYRISELRQDAAPSVIPATTLKAASGFGKLVAMRLLELADVLALLVEGAERAGYRGNRTGCQTRLAWAVTDSALHWELVADKVERRIRHRLWPMLLARRKTRDLLEAAHAENDAWNAPLHVYQVRAVLTEQIAEHLRRFRNA